MPEDIVMVVREGERREIFTAIPSDGQGNSIHPQVEGEGASDSTYTTLSLGLSAGVKRRWWRGKKEGEGEEDMLRMPTYTLSFSVM